MTTPTTEQTATLDRECIDTIRFLSVDMVEKAKSGHPGLPLGAAALAYVLWTRHLKHNPKTPDWPDRDRFVLSAGHGSALLYSLLHLTGYDLPLDELKNFRQWGSKTPGHPERGHTPGVEITTGPLGQGVANAVGFAIAEAQLAATYNKPGHTVIDHRTWVLASDGDLMEGVASEAASLAGHLQLNKLVVFYDDNSVTLAADTEMTFTEDRGARFAAYGWQVLRIDDGNDLDRIEQAIEQALAETARPTFIAVKTHLGYGSPVQDTPKAHGSPLGAENAQKTKEKLGWPVEPAFRIPDAALARFRQAERDGADAENEWKQRLQAYAQAHPAEAKELQLRLDGRLADDWLDAIPTFPADEKGMATRKAGGEVMNAIAAVVPQLCGGSADLDSSTFTNLKRGGDFGPPTGEPSENGTRSHAGRNIHFGVREHAMGAVVGGIAAHGGFIAYGSTFLIFSDYMRPPIRLAALSKLHCIHVFTHDSLGLGEDGPTHQPVEQLAALRALPNSCLLRPADANETAVAWRVAIEARDQPVLFALSRQDVPTLDRTQYASADGVRRGAYVLRDAKDGKAPELILIATGSEVALAVEAAKTLDADGVAVRIVSMPSWEIFDAQDQGYKDAVLPPAVKARLAIELGSPMGWQKWVGDHGGVVGIERFGASAPAKTLLKEYGFTVDNVVARAKALLA